MRPYLSFFNNLIKQILEYICHSQVGSRALPRFQSMFRVNRVSRLVQQGRGAVAGHRPLQGDAANHQGGRAGRPEPGGRTGAALQLRR